MVTMARITWLAAIAMSLVGKAVTSSYPKPPRPDTGLLQMVTYVKRHANMTQEEFWSYWKTKHAPKVVPLAVHFGISRYQQVNFLQQIQVGGNIVPTEAGASEPVSDELVSFDGIAMFLYASADILTAMLSHPYYLHIVEPDEHAFIDKSAYGKGMVATYVGKEVEVVDHRQDVWVGDQKTLMKYQKIFKTYRYS
ncbi:hypothetical protein FSARC_9112 [Fusarium sarcochroum]|uniref:EthD domain-containing protein n=1 Tax=Fusarium sarcochroum TaxID=1208366 RepID=A0A8H4TRZ2_9HYPO|nr:hypothetical protein FSARC_9112 [Fusarium sarcochroum]